ncbi:SEC-C metal-binding domain-containing protein [Moorena bouillonii]|uniref:Uncharacterized protein n=1 Tax=Moorena bouillonii PNG TaxID=568701 RepID=A0A1U7N0Y4_9CYAN|nr:SEC-C metal-binding domain-containing protein [Moorena bouillonii]ANM28704.1 hypothetical protein ABI59_02400 [Acidobacteria bacterium Mor1]OLT59613.1 hypothetical protein BJP37_11830 [Moorena bouillonii PNG]
MGGTGPKMGSKEMRRMTDSVPTYRTMKVKRNGPCPCGSSKKYKDCHAKDGAAFLDKLQRDQEQQRLKDQGVPWYKRLFQN